MLRIEYSRSKTRLLQGALVLLEVVTSDNEWNMEFVLGSPRGQRGKTGWWWKGVQSQGKDNLRGSVKGTLKMSSKPRAETSMGRWKELHREGKSRCKDPGVGRVAYV